MHQRTCPGLWVMLGEGDILDKETWRNLVSAAMAEVCWIAAETRFLKQVS